jgi:hypothetical protein
MVRVAIYRAMCAGFPGTRYVPVTDRAPVRFFIRRKHTCVGPRSLALRRFKLDGLRDRASVIRRCLVCTR